MLTKFLSAQWVDDGSGGQVIKAEGDDDRIYYITDPSSDVPPWPEYLAGGGIIAPLAVPVDDNILNAPDTLFGGPTMKEAFGGQ